MIVASDGLWAVMDSETAVQFVFAHLGNMKYDGNSGNSDILLKVSQALLQRSQELYVSAKKKPDDISIVIVAFGAFWADGPPPQIATAPAPVAAAPMQPLLPVKTE